MAITGSNAEFSENTIRTLSPLWISGIDSTVCSHITLRRSLRISSLATWDLGWLKISSTRLLPPPLHRPSMMATLVTDLTDHGHLVGNDHDGNAKPVRLISFRSSRIDEVVWGSSALVASSQSRIFGSDASALAMATLCFCPPESCAG